LLHYKKIYFLNFLTTYLGRVKYHKKMWIVYWRGKPLNARFKGRELWDMVNANDKVQFMVGWRDVNHKDGDINVLEEKTVRRILMKWFNEMKEWRGLATQDNVADITRRAYTLSYQNCCCGY